MILFLAVIGTTVMSATMPLYSVAWGKSADDVNKAKASKDMNYSGGIGMVLVGTIGFLG